MLNDTRSFLEVRIPNGLMPIILNRIVFIEAEKKCSIIYFDNYKDEALKTIETFHQLNWYMKFLHAPYFFRCHKSFLINCQFVNYYNRREITLHKKTKVPISRNTLKLFKENMDCFFEYQEMSFIG